MKKLITGFILGIILCSGIVYATSYLASDVLYTPNDKTWEVSNVEEALNSLYDGSIDIQTEMNSQNMYFNDKGGSAADGFISYNTNGYTSLTINSLQLKNTQANDWTHFYVYGVNGEEETELYYAYSSVVALQTYDNIDIDISNYERVKIVYNVFASYINIEELIIS